MKEFDYATLLRDAKELDMIFAMCERDYTPHSTPRFGGTLAIGIGRAIYYELFSEDQVAKVTSDIGHDLGACATTKATSAALTAEIQVLMSTGEFGGKYTGQVIDGKKHGQGIMEYSEGIFKGNVYVGAFKTDKREGHRKMTYATGRAEESSWLNGKIQGTDRFQIG